jgi:predicted phosphodiesterase
VPQQALTDEQLRSTLEAIRTHGSVSGAAKALGINRPTMQSRFDRARIKAAALGESVPSLLGARQVTTSSLPTSADDAWRELDRWIGRSARELATPPARRSKDGVERIVIAGDFHAPFHEPELVGELIARESKAADLLIVNGDVQDFYSISRFTKYEHVSIEEELGAVDALIGQLSRAFSRVVIVCGNHDKPRFEKQLRSLVSLDMMHVIEFLTGGTLDVVEVIARRYPNVTIARHHVGRYRVGWFYQHGDLICSHAEKFSKVPGAAMRGVHEWFVDRHETLGLQPWRVLIQAHTHQLGLFPWLADQLLIEGGCMCQTHGYQLDARVAGRPQRRGYVVLEQRDGVTDMNSVRLRWWDQRV